MTVRTLVRYPDPRLALAAQPVTVFNDALRILADDLRDTMHAAPGIGITARISGFYCVWSYSISATARQPM